MKKIIALVISIAIASSFCACGNSSAVKAVEKSIDAIGEVSIDSKDEIESVENAYNALSDTEKKKVKNYSVLEEAKNSLAKQEYKVQYKEILDDISYMCSQSESLVSATRTLWDSQGTDILGQTIYLADQLDTLNMTEEEFAKDFDELGKDITHFMYLYNSVKNQVSENNEELNQRIKDLKDKYGDDADKSESIQALIDYYIECSSYADFATNPSGNKITYNQKADEYETKIKSLYKKVDLAGA